jgi:hypothetical protein
MTGSWPTVLVDHRDGERSNNRWDNLRLATDQQNGQNRKACSRSTTGIVGVVPSGDGYRAHIAVHRQVQYLGTFETLEEAKAARLTAEEKLFGDYAGSKRPGGNA